MKHQQNILLIFLVSLIFISWAYSASPPKYGGIIRFAVSQKDISLDPINILTSTEYFIADSIFDGLVRYGKNKELLPGIASSWEVSEDQSIYTFYIIDSAKFHNGRAINANDVRYSLQRSIKNAEHGILAQSVLKLISGSDSYRSGKSNSVRGLQALDKNTIQISLAQANEFFLRGLNDPLTWIIPLGSAENEDFGKKPIGSGPFRVAQSSDTEGEILNLVAYEDYIWGRPYLDRVIFVSASDFSTLLLRFETGDLDCLEVPNIEIGRFRNAPGWSSQLDRLDESQLTYLRINRKAFAEKTKINSLLKHGIDVTSILDMLYNQGKSLSDSDYQLERAKKEAGEFQNNRIKLIILDLQDTNKIADRISFDLLKAGVVLDIKTLDRQNFYKSFIDGSYSLALFSLSSSYNNVDNINRNIYIPLFYQNTNFLQKPEVQKLSESYLDGIIRLDDLYILKSQKTAQR